jgi:hypothetical protein
MGLFNVNMTLFYGEGKRAFIRLQQAIAQVSDDPSIFVWEFPNRVELTPIPWFGSLREYPSSMFATSPAAFGRCGDIERQLFPQELDPRTAYEIPTSRRWLRMLAGCYWLGDANAQEVIDSIRCRDPFGCGSPVIMGTFWRSMRRRVRDNAPTAPLEACLGAEERDLPEDVGVAVLPCGNKYGRIGILVCRYNDGLIERFHTDDISLVFLVDNQIAPDSVQPHYFKLDDKPTIDPRPHPPSPSSSLSLLSKFIIMSIERSNLTGNYMFESSETSHRVWPIPHRGEEDQSVCFISADGLTADWPSFQVRWRYERDKDDIFVRCEVRRHQGQSAEAGILDLIGSSAMITRGMHSQRSSRSASQVRQPLNGDADVVIRIRMAPTKCHLIVQIERHSDARP